MDTRLRPKKSVSFIGRGKIFSGGSAGKTEGGGGGGGGKVNSHNMDGDMKLYLRREMRGSDPRRTQL